jgi:hypothetical protein
MASSCEHCNKPLDSTIKGREILDQLSNYQLFKKDSIVMSGRAISVRVYGEI